MYPCRSGLSVVKTPAAAASSCWKIRGPKSSVASLDLSDPFSIRPHGLEGGEVARIENVFGGGPESAAFDVVPRVAGADGHKLKYARIAVAIDHAPRAPVPDELRRVELVD